jgi:hypothetical protein
MEVVRVRTLADAVEAVGLLGDADRTGASWGAEGDA